MKHENGEAENERNTLPFTSCPKHQVDDGDKSGTCEVKILFLFVWFL